jgi:hypothetical protein
LLLSYFSYLRIHIFGLMFGSEWPSPSYPNKIMEMSVYLIGLAIQMPYSRGNGF